MAVSGLRQPGNFDHLVFTAGVGRGVDWFEPSRFDPDRADQYPCHFQFNDLGESYRLADISNFWKYHPSATRTFGS